MPLRSTRFSQLSVFAWCAFSEFSLPSSLVHGQYFRPVVQDHPLEIFHHAIKYRNQTLIDQAAPYIAFHPALDIVERLPPDLVLPWVTPHHLRFTLYDWRITTCIKLRYHQAVLNSTFQPSKRFLQESTTIFSITQPNGMCHDATSRIPSTITATSECHRIVVLWLGFLENLSTFAELANELEGSALGQHNQYLCHRCGLFSHVAKCCKEDLEKAKLIKFTSFFWEGRRDMGNMIPFCWSVNLSNFGGEQCLINTWPKCSADILICTITFMCHSPSAILKR